jgi:hypothetical protein
VVSPAAGRLGASIPGDDVLGFATIDGGGGSGATGAGIAMVVGSDLREIGTRDVGAGELVGTAIVTGGGSIALVANGPGTIVVRTGWVDPGIGLRTSESGGGAEGNETGAEAGVAGAAGGATVAGTVGVRNAEGGAPIGARLGGGTGWAGRTAAAGGVPGLLNAGGALAAVLADERSAIGGS